jgi:hypothetical protein
MCNAPQRAGWVVPDRRRGTARRVRAQPHRTSSDDTLAIRFISQVTHFFAVLLWVAALLALIADWWMPGQGMATLAIAIVAVSTIDALALRSYAARLR